MTSLVFFRSRGYTVPIHLPEGFRKNSIGTY